jgi:Family of unknown function (DUF6056)
VGNDSDATLSDESPVNVWAGRLGWLVLLVVLGQICFTAGRFFRYTSPIADEMVLAGTVRAVGVGQYLADMYLHWTGRWSGVGLFMLAGRYLDFRIAYGWLLAAIQLSVPISIYALLSAAFADRLARRTRAILSIGLVALHWAGEPSLKDAYYWLTGAIENHLSVSLGLFLVAGLIRIGNRKPSRWAITGLCALAAVATGMHQVYGIYLCVALLFGTVLAYRVGIAGRHAWAIAAGVAIIGLAVCTLAPGNAYRIGAEKPHHEFWWFQSLARWWATLVLETWMMDLKLWLATLVVLCHPRAAGAVPAWLREKRGLWAMIAATATAGVIFIALLANWWTFPRPLPFRTQSAIYLLFLLGWFATAFALAAGPALKAPRPVWAGMAACFALALVAFGNYPIARADLNSGRAMAFHWAVRNRDRVIRDALAAGDHDLVVPPITLVPDCLLFVDVVDQSVSGPCWYNEGYCKYYRLDSIRPQTAKEIAGAK